MLTKTMSNRTSCPKRQVSMSRGVRSCVVIGLCISAALSMLSVALPEQVRAAEQRRSRIIFLFDNSRSMYVGAPGGSGDPTKQSYKMARFLVRYLQSMAEAARYEVGAANFATRVDDEWIISPLRPVEAWSETDILQIKPYPCPADDDPRKGIKGQDPCYGTFRSSAINWAVDQLMGCQDDAESACQIIMFTDDKTREDNSESEDDLKVALQSIPAFIDFRVVLFPDDLTDSGTKSAWHQWSLETRSAGDKALVQQPILNTDIGTAVERHRQLIDLVLLEESRDGEMMFELPSSFPSLVSWSAPNVDMVEVSLVSTTSTLVETFTPHPDFRAGAKRVWYSPKFYNLGATFHIDAAPGNEVAVLRIITHTVPIEVEVVFWPDPPEVIQPLEIRALVRAGSKVLADPDRLLVTARLDPKGEKITMRPNQSSGVWAGTVPPLMRGGSFELNVEVTPVGWHSDKIKQPPRRSIHLKDPSWSVELFVDPETALADQMRSFEVVIKLDGEQVFFASETKVSARLRETREAIPLLPLNGTWRGKHQVNKTQDVVVAVCLSNGEVLSSTRKVEVVERPLARVQELPHGIRFWDFLSYHILPTQIISATVFVSPTYTTLPNIYVQEEGRAKRLGLQQLGNGRYQFQIERPEHFNTLQLFSDNAVLTGDIVFEGRWLLWSRPILLAVLLLLVVVIVGRFVKNRQETDRWIKEAVSGNEKALLNLSRVFSVRKPSIRQKLAEELTPYLAEEVRRRNDERA